MRVAAVAGVLLLAAALLPGALARRRVPVACWEATESLCPDANGEAGALLSCLQANAAALPERCSQAMAAMEQGSASHLRGLNTETQCPPCLPDFHQDPATCTCFGAFRENPETTEGSADDYQNWFSFCANINVGPLWTHPNGQFSLPGKLATPVSQAQHDLLGAMCADIEAQSLCMIDMTLQANVWADANGSPAFVDPNAFVAGTTPRRTYYFNTAQMQYTATTPTESALCQYTPQFKDHLTDLNAPGYISPFPVNAT